MHDISSRRKWRLSSKAVLHVCIYMVVLYSDNVSEECYLQDDVKPKWLCRIVSAKGVMTSSDVNHSTHRWDGPCGESLFIAHRSFAFRSKAGVHTAHILSLHQPPSGFISLAVTSRGAPLCLRSNNSLNINFRGGEKVLGFSCLNWDVVTSAADTRIQRYWFYCKLLHGVAII